MLLATLVLPGVDSHGHGKVGRADVETVDTGGLGHFLQVGDGVDVLDHDEANDLFVGMGKIVGPSIEWGSVRADAAEPDGRVTAGHSGFCRFFTVVDQRNYDAIGPRIQHPLDPHGVVPGNAG